MLSTSRKVPDAVEKDYRSASIHDFLRQHDAGSWRNRRREGVRQRRAGLLSGKSYASLGMRSVDASFLSFCHVKLVRACPIFPFGCTIDFLQLGR